MGNEQGVTRPAFIPGQSDFVTAVLSLFSHQTLWHLLANLLFLAAVGAAVETTTGAWRYAVLYLGGGLVGLGAHAAVVSASGGKTGLIGASACVAACIGFAAVRYGAVKIPILPKVRVPVWSLVVVWVLLQVVGAVTQSMGGIGFVAHLGGLLWGVLGSFVLNAPSAAAMSEAVAQLERMGERGIGAQRAALVHLVEANTRDAANWLRLAEHDRTLGETEEEIKALLQVVDHGDMHQLEQAVSRLEELNALGQLSPVKRMKLAQHALPTTKGALWRSVALGPSDERERPQALLELAAVDAQGPWIEILERDHPMDPATDLARRRGML